VPLFEQLHPEWQKELEIHRALIEQIDHFLQAREIAPSHDLVFRSLTAPIDSTRVVIFGQDPYPTKGHAHGLAFLLINRILSTDVGVSNAHVMLGWQAITNTVASVLGRRGVIAVLWGKSALELKAYFPEDLVIASVHPSPLSAYRGFFGSKPFSQVNEKLKQQGLPTILWQ